MKHNTIINLLRPFVIVLFLIALSCNSEQNDFSERTKIALRDAGNKLLLSQGDSTSLILPIKQIQPNKFQLQFNSLLSFEPGTLVEAIEHSLKSSKLPEHYIVEVIQCEDKEVAYSYQMTAIIESTIIPCSERFLPQACYSIEVNFTKRVAPNSETTFFIGLIIGLTLMLFGYLWYRKKSKNNIEAIALNYEAIGSFKFYPEQNKLIKEAEEIALSKKECELLALFVERPNEIIKRDELTKKVWEDNGVFVGRSLDTYISKLRKKLQADTSIKITNVHGVGYKLELS